VAADMRLLLLLLSGVTIAFSTSAPDPSPGLLDSPLHLQHLTVEDPLNDWQPRHVHLTQGTEEGSLLVTWSTVNNTEESVVIIQGGKSYNGNSEIFVDGGENHLSQWIHKVQIGDLKPNSTYFYRVGSHRGWSSIIEMRTLPKGRDWSPSIALFGDMGTDNAVSLSYLQEEAEDGHFHAMIHVGDMAYDMDEHDGQRGDEFMSQVEPIASMIPYMTCPGNHENAYNFSNYKARFGNSMPRDNGNMFYSFNLGPVHFISISTEFYYYLNYGLQQALNQFNWIEQDLATVDRSATPWVVIFGHRPMYCTNSDRKDCSFLETRTRVGLPLLHWWGLEDLLVKYGVDLAVWAHEHSYERLYPTYNRTVVPSPNPDMPYVDPRAPVHVTTGSAGCREKHDGFLPDPPVWSAFRTMQYGYTRMKVANATHLYLEQVDVETDGQPVIDSVWLVQHNHGPFSGADHQAV